MSAIRKTLALGLIAALMVLCSEAVLAAQLAKPGGGIIKPVDSKFATAVVQGPVQATKPNAPSGLMPNLTR